MKNISVEKGKENPYRCIVWYALLTDFYQPLKEDELEQSTEVQIIFPAEQKPVRFFISEKLILTGTRLSGY